tara:strand:+ start:1021 stop:2412 length:1392 start_codon:yes stop_codon:yes gene_type:complete
MKTFELKRQVPIDSSYDLVVCGGGPAGCSAAIAAARLGGKVLLIEATGCLGGMGSSGLVTAFDPMANGEVALVRGIMGEIVQRVHDRGFTGPQVTPDFWSKNYHCWTPFNAEGYKLILDELCAEAGIEVRFFTRLIDVDVTGQHVNGVMLNNIEGHRYVPAKTFVDATGDAVLTHLCGAACREAGRDTDHIMPPTLCSVMSNIHWQKAQSDLSRTGPDEQQKYLNQAVDDGFFSHTDRHLPGLFKISPTMAALNGGHMFHTNALNCKSLSDGMVRGRQLAQEYLAFYRKYVPGCENMEHATTASLMGIRESRRIVGEYELNVNDYLARRQFPDQIGVFNKAIDIHVYDDSPEQYARFCEEYGSRGRLNAGECFGIPYGILVPKGWQNLWVAGRCVSSDVQVHGSIRVQPAASMMGQAAGTAAMQSIRNDEVACELNTAVLIEQLRKDHAYLPQSDLSPTMTRG